MKQYIIANTVLSMFSKNYMELKKNLPVRPSEMGVLNIIAELPGPHTPVMVADLLHVSKPMISAHLRVLEKKGYIVKEPSNEDKRAYYIMLSEKGMELVRSAKVELGSYLDQLKNEMGQEEFEHFIQLAKKANEILESANEKER